MSVKRVYYEREQTKVTKEKGWIEVESDYTQLYHCFSLIAPKIKSATTFKLLFWLLANKTNEYNGIDTRMKSFAEFNTHLENTCGDTCSVTYRTYMRCMNELKEAGALTSIGKGNYYANPEMFWQASISDRAKFLGEEQKHINTEPLLLHEPTGAVTDAPED